MVDDQNNTPDDRSETDHEEALPVGERLREARKKAGLSEAQVAQALHLDLSIVEALEAGRFESLGAPIFVKGHLRNYARLVELDPTDIVSGYDALYRSTPPELSTPPTDGIRMDEHGGVGSRIAWIILALIIIGIGVWLYQSNRLAGLTHPQRASQTQSVVQPQPTTRGLAFPTAKPTQRSPLLKFRQPSQHQATANAAPSSGSVTVPTAQSSMPAQQSESVAPTATKPKTAAPPASAPATPTKQAKLSQPVAKKAAVPIVLKVSADSWVEVDDANGNRLYYGLAVKGDVLKLKGEAPLSVFLGNAPGVQVVVTGTAVKVQTYTRSNNTARFVIHESDDGSVFASKPSGP